jgi:hypothetical protein
MKRTFGHFVLKEAHHAVCVNSVVAASDRLRFASRHGSNDSGRSFAPPIRLKGLNFQDGIAIDHSDRSISMNAA